MSTNPYSSPPISTGGSTGKWPGDQPARDIVRGPATALMIVSIIWLVCLVASLCFDVALLASGTAQRMEQPGIGISKETQITIRFVAGILFILSNAVILFAAIKMRNLQNYSLARVGALLAVIPCTGPCYLLGIPFGIWAFVALSNPSVKSAFR